MASDREPWWSADDEEFSGATPIFSDSEDAAGESTPRTDPPEPGAGSSRPGTGSPVAEALRLAAAVSSWSQQTGLTDQLKDLAGEAGAVLAMRAATAAAAASADQDDESDDDTSRGAATSDFAVEHGSTCEVCPLCRGVDLLRAVQPQLAEGVTEAMASISFALETALANMDDNRN